MASILHALAAEASPTVSDRRGGGTVPPIGAAPVHRDPLGVSAPLPTLAPDRTRVVLVVDDDAKLAGLLVRALNHAGLRGEPVRTGDAALRRIQAPRPLDAIVLDVMIPHPDGIEVCQKARRDGWSGPIIMISARSSQDDRRRALLAGADRFLPKPFRLSELVRSVTDLVDRSSSRHTGRTRS